MRLISLLRSLTRYDEHRLNAAVARLQHRPAAMFCFNALLVGLNGVVRLRQLLVRNRFASASTAVGSTAVDAAGVASMPPRWIPASPSVLIVCEESIPQCFRYRVAHRLEELEALGHPSHWLSWKDTERVRNELHFFDVVVFYRVPGFPPVLDLIHYARTIGRVVCYDIDDLVFDAQRLREKFHGRGGRLRRDEVDGLLRGAVLYRKALAACPRAWVSTPALAQEVSLVLGDGTTEVIPNRLDAATARVAARPVIARDERVWFVYGSGTRTHDKDLAMIAAPLADVLRSEPNTGLCLVGEVTLPEELRGFGARVLNLPPLDYVEYLQVLRRASVNLAPVEPGTFADCKSEIKWLEAAAVDVPTVATPTRTFLQAIRDGEDGILAGDAAQWSKALCSLARSSELRRRIATAARARVQRDYGPAAAGTCMSHALERLLDSAERDGVIIRKNRAPVRIVFVSTLYPPQSIGGATVVVRNLVTGLRDRYPQRYEPMVFCHDLEGARDYKFNESIHDGVRVTRLAVPVKPDMDLRHRDDNVYALFRQWLEAVRPDVIHFHSVQRLSASVLRAAKDLGIPHLVTVHDAWWLSDHQFLLTREGDVCDPLQSDPLVASRSSRDLGATLRRMDELRGDLEAADVRLAVSRFQKDLYERNGVANVRVHRNGVDKPSQERRTVGEGDPSIVFGFLGGQASHKGFSVLKAAVEGAELKNSRLRILDPERPAAAGRQLRWGTTPVSMEPGLPHERIGEFYAGVDVVLAPSIWPESFGLVSREAVLAGCWVVASDIGALAEDLVPGRNADVVTPGDVAGLRDVLRRIDAAAVPPRPDSTAAGAIQSVDAQVEELDALVESLLDPGEKPVVAELPTSPRAG